MNSIFFPFESVLDVGSVDFETLTNDSHGLFICLRVGGANKYEIMFENFFYYNWCNESDDLKLLSEIYENCKKSIIYASEKSTLISNFIKNGFNVLSSEGLVHYVIVTDEDIIQVISYSEPTIRMVSNRI